MLSYPNTTSVILAGGLSSRMGRDKALLRLTPGGPTMLETVAVRLSEAGLPPALIVTNRPEEHTLLGVPALPDVMPEKGPLGGILTALLYATRERVLVVACDMPLLSPDLLRYMATLPGDAVVPHWADADGVRRVEPLHAIYSVSCIETIQEQIAQGKLRLTGLPSVLKVRYVEESVLRKYDPQLNSFRNVNTPEEWSLFEAQRRPGV